MEADKTRLRGFSFPWVTAVPDVCEPPVSLQPVTLGPCSYTERSLVGVDLLVWGCGASSCVLPGNHCDEDNYYHGNRDQSYIRRDEIH